MPFSPDEVATKFEEENAKLLAEIIVKIDAKLKTWIPSQTVLNPNKVTLDFKLGPNYEHLSRVIAKIYSDHGWIVELKRAVSLDPKENLSSDWVNFSFSSAKEESDLNKFDLF